MNAARVVCKKVASSVAQIAHASTTVSSGLHRHPHISPRSRTLAHPANTIKRRKLKSRVATTIRCAGPTKHTRISIGTSA